jgi:hypothetical protein
MAWPFAGQSTDAVTDDENSRERLIEMGGVAIEEVPLPDAGDLTEEEAWTISPGPARARIGATDVAAVMAKALPSVGDAQPLQATSMDTSGLERMVSNRLDSLDDTMLNLESRLLEMIPDILVSLGKITPEQAAALSSGDDRQSATDSGEGDGAGDGEDGDAGPDAGSGDTIITADGEVINVGNIDNARLMAEDAAPLLELYEAQALAINPFLASLDGLEEIGAGSAIGAHNISALLLDHLTGMAATSFVNKAKSSGLFSDEEARQVGAIVQMAAPGAPDDALKDHLPDRELLTLCTLVTVWRSRTASA